MIIRNKTGAIIIFKEVAFQLFLLLLWDIFIVVAFELFHQEWMDQPELPIALFGSALALFLGIRNNTAYARWWEARTLWGAVLNHCRSLNRETATLFPEDIWFMDAIIAYPALLTSMLLGEDVKDSSVKEFDADFQKALKKSNNAPLLILYELSKRLDAEGLKHKIDGAIIAQVEDTVANLTNSQGGLERICRTPLPIQYSFLSTLGTHLFCIILPLSAVQTLGWFTPLGATAAGIVFQMLNRCGADLQDPFDGSPHSLPMRAITRVIETDILEKRNFKTRSAYKPVDGVLH